MSCLGCGSAGRVELVQTVDGPVAQKTCLVPVSDQAELGVSGEVCESQILLYANHPNIMTGIEARWQQLNGPYEMTITMTVGELDLYRYLTSEEDLTDDRRVTIAAQILNGLLFLHENLLLHGDLKPENVIMIDGQAVLADFNLAIPLYGQANNKLRYTLEYRSPAASRMLNHTFADDIWAYGQILADDLFPNTTDPKILAVLKLCKNSTTTARQLTETEMFQGREWTVGSWLTPLTSSVTTTSEPPPTNLLTYCPRGDFLILPLLLDIHERVPLTSTLLQQAAQQLLLHLFYSRTAPVEYVVGKQNLALLITTQLQLLTALNYLVIRPDNWAKTCRDAKLRDKVVVAYYEGRLPDEQAELYRQRRYSELIALVTVDN